MPPQNTRLITCWKLEFIMKMRTENDDKETADSPENQKKAQT